MAAKWSRKLTRPIALNDGRALATLSEARAFILALPEPHQHSERWRYAEELLNKAAENGEKYAVMDASAQLNRALKAEGLL